MFVFRPIRESDLDAFVALAFSIQGALTNLPKDADVLAERIAESRRAFDPGIRKPGGEFYFFVLENTATGELLGTSGLVARVGGFEPFYSYEIRDEVFRHEPLNITRPQRVLHLKRVHRGPTEVCSLFLRAGARGGGLGRLLSLARFLFIRAFPQRFDETLLAEMRGYTEADDRSPFWEAVGRHFFDCDLQHADLLCGQGKDFIADLMPTHPLYVALLPPIAQTNLGRCHRDTEPALALLRSEGFSSNGEIDIFDAGPLVHARLHEVRTIRESRTMPVVGIERGDLRPPDALLSNGRLDFRACLGMARPQREGVLISREVAEALDLATGDSITCSPLRGSAAVAA